MRKAVCLLLPLICVISVFSQSIERKLETAYKVFASDSQMKHAVSSLYVIDARTGKVVFDRNSQLGLAPASTQKIITSVTAFELLGKDFRYKTEITTNGRVENGILSGDIYLKSSSDPTFGSWRWESTRESNILKEIVAAFKNKNIREVEGIPFLHINNFDQPATPDGWIWQDIGNYYGAGAGALNWRENQFDLVLKSGLIRGSAVEVVRTHPKLHNVEIVSGVKAASPGTGDNAYIYLPIAGKTLYVKGTIPIAQSSFVISGAIPNPSEQFTSTLSDTLRLAGITNKLKLTELEFRDGVKNYLETGNTTIYSHQSPPLDSIIYWFNKRSINLYGEALVKTIAFQKNGLGVTDTGINIIRRFWKEKGLDEDELNMYDGSGLSPLNRVTTHAQVSILKYAQNREWYPYFYNALPEFNNMKMKSGTISDVKGFCGYHKSGNGNEYIFSFLVNNYSGTASGIVNKMYRVLDVLK